MATQNAHFVPYLICTEVDLSQNAQAQEVIMIPKASELIYLSVEVVEAANAGTLDLGYDGQESNLANDIDLTQKGVHIANVATTTKKLEYITAKPSGASSGVFKIRAQYYLPSTKTFELQ